MLEKVCALLRIPYDQRTPTNALLILALVATLIATLALTIGGAIPIAGRPG